MAQIEIRNVSKVYRVSKKEKGLLGSVRGLFRPVREDVRAVDGISLEIAAGEIVGFIGPNGAGKSTTIKMLSGILQPTSGRITIDGRSPQEERKTVVKNLGVVFGQRTQLFWDLRLGESFELLKRIYEIGETEFTESVQMLSDVLAIHDLMDVPVRQLSLGQRMRGELAAAMLHSPPILFLDEPTIGMDIEVKSAIRQFILEVNRTRRTTVLLTTHDLNDVEELCQRVVVINRGQIVVDSSLKEMIATLAPYRHLVVECAGGGPGHFSHPHAEVVDRSGEITRIRFDRNRTSASDLISEFSKHNEIRDISVMDPDIEEVIRKIYRA